MTTEAKKKHPGGRPRTRTPLPDDLIKLGEELVQWATEPTTELRCRFCEWYSLKKGILDREWHLMTEKEEFHVYYEKARVALSKRYLNGSVNVGIAHRFLRIYAPEVKIEETAIKLEDHELQKKLAEFMNSIKKETLETVSDEVKGQFDSLMNQITKMQNRRK